MPPTTPPTAAAEDVAAAAAGDSTPEPSGTGFEVLRLEPVPADPDSKVERLPIFYIGDTEHTVLAHPPFSLSVDYLYRCRTEGVGSAMDWLLDEMLGVESYQALRTYPQLTPVLLGKVIAIVSRLALGPLELPKGPASE